MKRIVCLALVLLLLAPVWAGAELSAWFLDVGQGDCTVIVCDGECMVIDGGPVGSSQFVYSFLREQPGLEYIDYVIATHPHEDHVGGLTAVLNAAPADLILSPVAEWETSEHFSDLMRYADRSGTPVSVPADGDQMRLGGAVVTVLHCWPEAAEWTGGNVDPVNDMSIVVRIDYGETSFVIAGDAEAASEYMMIDSGLPLKADVLRVAHHGSRYSTTEEFLKAVSPSYAVISCGEGNRYFHPHGSVLNLLQKNGAFVFRTDLQGTVKCVSDGKAVKFSVNRWADREELYTAPGREAGNGGS
ncbi:MAG: MBL fold metallo-hydrolase [Clostridia bacterium]|nr:MBL fold metallo-hydrolase [Clostridia bacterium]